MLVHIETSTPSSAHSLWAMLVFITTHTRELRNWGCVRKLRLLTWCFAAWWVSHKINFRPTKRERTCFGEQIFIYFNTNLVNLHLDTNWPPITSFGHHFNFLARVSQNWMYSKEYIYAAFKNQMKPSQETSEANIGFRHTLMPPYFRMHPSKAAFFCFQTQPEILLLRNITSLHVIRPRAELQWLALCHDQKSGKGFEIYTDN